MRIYAYDNQSRLTDIHEADNIFRNDDQLRAFARDALINAIRQENIVVITADDSTNPRVTLDRPVVEREPNMHWFNDFVTYVWKRRLKTWRSKAEALRVAASMLRFMFGVTEGGEALLVEWCDDLIWLSQVAHEHDKLHS